MDDESIFPSKVGVPFPRNFVSSVQNIFKRLFRVYAHIYHSHFPKIVSLGEEAHLNTSFKVPPFSSNLFWKYLSRFLLTNALPCRHAAFYIFCAGVQFDQEAGVAATCRAYHELDQERKEGKESQGYKRRPGGREQGRLAVPLSFSSNWCTI